jgi:transcriptional regulator with PAS, ATPase and Fis domain
MAHGGTIFLDEIAELSLKSQAKLLQVLEEKTFERVGESTPISADFRIISATNRNLLSRIREGSFRRDLFFRLNTIHLRIPPLRERTEDIALLVRCFTTNFSEKLQKPEAKYTSGAINSICQYSWPGNVRELENMVERIMILKAGQVIAEADIAYFLQSPEPVESDNGGRFYTREQMEKIHIEKALDRCGGIVGGKNGAARLLGIPRSTLQYRMKKLEIRHPVQKSPSPSLYQEDNFYKDDDDFFADIDQESRYG